MGAFLKVVDRSLLVLHLVPILTLRRPFLFLHSVQSADVESHFLSAFSLQLLAHLDVLHALLVVLELFLCFLLVQHVQEILVVNTQLKAIALLQDDAVTALKSEGVLESLTCP